MDLHLAGKRVFISGSTQGIGYAVAARCAAEGASVIINGRDQQRVDSTVDRLHEARTGSDVTGIAADLTDISGLQSLLDSIGHVDVLVNNAGIFDVAPFTEIPDETWQQYFDLNVLSAVRLSRHLLPLMLDRGWGRVVFINTESAVDVPADMIHYGAMKAAALALGNGLAKLTRGTDVTVNTVLAGPTYSDGVATTVEGIASAQSVAPESLKSQLVRQTSLIQRFIEPEEIASLVAYLASPASSAINGAALRADGGVLTTTL